MQTARTFNKEEVVVKRNLTKRCNVAKQLFRETNISVPNLTSIAINGDGPSLGNPIPNCRAMNELGITFLNTKDTEERQAIENTFAGILQNPDAGDNIKFVALAFLKRPDAIVTGISKDIVAEFENNTDNATVVNAVKERLARD